MQVNISGKEEAQAGQVLVILVLVLAGLLGFAALAIDGGMYFSDRRFSQNVADASALAAASAAVNSLESAGARAISNCSTQAVLNASQAAENAAIQNAAGNNIALDNDLSDDNGVQVFCYTDNGGYLDVEVKVTTQVGTSFAHLLFGGSLFNTVEAVTRINSSDSLTYGNAILSLRSDCHGNDGGITFSGSGVIDVVSGGIFSNSCLVINGSNVSVTSQEDISYISTFHDPAYHAGSPNVDPYPLQVSQPVAKPHLEAPNCGALPASGQSKNGGTISPGAYSQISLTSHKTLIMEPGLYCISGDFKATGGTIQVSGTENEGVTIYITGGEFKVAGNVDVNLRAPMLDNPANYAVRGLLIYLAEGNTGRVDLQGNSTSTYRGTVFAPDGTIEASGTSGATGMFSTQFVADTVVVNGNADLEITYTDDMVVNGPVTLSLYK